MCRLFQLSNHGIRLKMKSSSGLAALKLIGVGRYLTNLATFSDVKSPRMGRVSMGRLEGDARGSEL